LLWIFRRRRRRRRRLGGGCQGGHLIEIGAHEALDRGGVGLDVGQALLDGGADQVELRTEAQTRSNSGT